MSFGVRNLTSRRIRQVCKECPGTECKSVAEAIQESEIVILAIPWNAVRKVCSENLFEGKILVDCTNPILQGFELDHPDGKSGAEQVREWANGAKVVKCFNTIGRENFGKMMDADIVNHQFGGLRLDMYIAGDDEKSKNHLSEIVGRLGFVPIDCGPLSRARFTEALAMLYISLSSMPGNNRKWGFKMIHEIEERPS